LIYAAGFPERTKLIEAGTLNITEGKIKGKANQGNLMGYSLIYSNDTYYGMSGGPVLNSEGELVVIHGQGEREENGQRDEKGRRIKTDRNLGIPIERFGTVASTMGLKLNQQIAALPQNQPLNASDYFLRGEEKESRLNYFGALADYNQAIILNPKYSEAYLQRAGLKAVRDVQGALADYNQAIALDPNDPDKSDAYYSRGILKCFKLKNKVSGVQDLQRAAKLYREGGQVQKAQKTFEVLRQLGVN
jgi:tetratricopeptide (TPR) repeat protein